MPLSVDNLYKKVEYIINVSRTGNRLGPAQFNSLMNEEQDNLFLQRLGLPETYPMGNPTPKVGYQTSKIHKDLSPFKRKINVQLDGGGRAMNSAYPNDYYMDTAYRVRAIVPIADDALNKECASNGIYGGTQDQVYNVYEIPVHHLDSDKIGHRLTSRNLGPKLWHPMAALYGDHTQFYPIGAYTEVVMDYLKRPARGEWAYNSVSTIPVYDAAGSTDLEWDESLLNNLAFRICSRVGINLSKQEKVQYSEAKIQQGE